MIYPQHPGWELIWALVIYFKDEFGEFTLNW